MEACSSLPVKAGERVSAQVWASLVDHLSMWYAERRAYLSAGNFSKMVKEGGLMKTFGDGLLCTHVLTSPLL